MSGFAQQVKAWSEKTQKAATMVLRGSALEIFSSVIRRTPVKTGRLRGNWQAELNFIPSGEVETSANQALATARKETGLMKLTDTIYMMNNLPYVVPIENGSSEQAPAGMVRVTLAEWRRKVNELARKHSK